MNCFTKAATMALVLLSPTVAFCADAGTKADKAPAAKIYKVSELFQDKANLDKQNVTVKGKVVKVVARIMNKNWIHLQDGSGDARKKTNDLTITTSQELPEVGKIVTVNGTLHKDRNFGSGYFYEVILEDATIK